MIVVQVTLEFIVNRLEDFDVLVLFEHFLGEEEAHVAGFFARDAGD